MPVSNPAQRDRILREALVILARDGERGLTVRTVAAASGCSTTGLYTYFNGRPGLLDAILVDGFDRLDAAVVAASEGMPPSAAAIAVRCAAYTQFAVSRPVQYELMFAAPVPDFERSAHVSSCAAASFVLFRDAVAAAIDAGDIDRRGVGAALLAGSLWATMHGHAILGNLWPPELHSEMPWEHDVGAVIGWLLGGTSEPPPAPA